MTLRTRRLLYITCVIIFVLAAPPLVLYTAGWRLDLAHRRLVETGSLVVKSTPEKADVYLNNKLHPEKTPTIINNILPGKINLEVKKDGYYAWQKTIAVAPRFSTFVENIKLFLQVSPLPLIAGPIEAYWWNKSQDKIAYLNNKKQLRLYNTLNGKDTFLVNLTNKPLQKILWSPHDDFLLVSRGNATSQEHFIIDTLSPEKFLNLREMVRLPLSNLQWDELSVNTLYGLSGGALYRIPYLLKTTRLVLPGPLEEYRAEKDRIIFIESPTKNKIKNLGWIDTSDPKTKHYLTFRNNASFDTIVKTNTSLVAVINSRQKTLTIFDPSIQSDNIETFLEIPNIQKVIWSAHGQKLIYAENGAIYQRTFTASPPVDWPPKNPAELITRYSQPIDDIFWSDDENYLFYSLAGTLRVLEIGPPAEPRSLTLLENAPIIKQPEFTDSAKIVTFINSNDDLLALPISAKEERAFLFGD